MRSYVSEASRNVFISAQESNRQIKEHRSNKTKQKTKEKMFLVDDNVLFLQASPAEETVAWFSTFF